MNRIVEAGTAAAFEVPRGGAVEVVNTHGSQVVDTWALTADEPRRPLSLAHSRGVLGRFAVRVGDAFCDDLRRPVLTVEADTSPGVHDTLIPACDPRRYELLGHPGHANCADNYAKALAAAGVPAPDHVPHPLNLFMNVPWDADGELRFAAPVSRPGDAVVLRALVDLVVVLSACPQDLVPVNGDLLRPRDVEVRLHAPRGAGAP
ncbi:DUF1989 domain-containing protein [Saccharothrix sp. HUAS TT1]|uniref:DUF1989 domain-containing protein n=1 Tax=unclassified Saccharothrix TaxID=2593673 RepID=UPI00345B8927